MGAAVSADGGPPPPQAAAAARRPPPAQAAAAARWPPPPQAAAAARRPPPPKAAPPRPLGTLLVPLLLAFLLLLSLPRVVLALAPAPGATARELFLQGGLQAQLASLAASLSARRQLPPSARLEPALEAAAQALAGLPAALGLRITGAEGGGAAVRLAGAVGGAGAREALRGCLRAGGLAECYRRAGLGDVAEVRAALEAAFAERAGPLRASLEGAQRELLQRYERFAAANPQLRRDSEAAFRLALYGLYGAARRGAALAVAEARVDVLLGLAAYLNPVDVVLNPRVLLARALQLVFDNLKTLLRALSYANAADTGQLDYTARGASGDGVGTRGANGAGGSGGGAPADGVPSGARGTAAYRAALAASTALAETSARSLRALAEGLTNRTASQLSSAQLSLAQIRASAECVRPPARPLAAGSPPARPLSRSPPATALLIATPRIMIAGPPPTAWRATWAPSRRSWALRWRAARSALAPPLTRPPASVRPRCARSTRLRPRRGACGTRRAACWTTPAPRWAPCCGAPRRFRRP